MATIINFAGRQNARAENIERPAGPAQILFFTGVRYERGEQREARLQPEEPSLPLAL